MNSLCFLLGFVLLPSLSPQDLLLTDLPSDGPPPKKEHFLVICGVPFIPSFPPNIFFFVSDATPLPPPFATIAGVLETFPSSPWFLFFSACHPFPRRNAFPVFGLFNPPDQILWFVLMSHVLHCFVFFFFVFLPFLARPSLPLYTENFLPPPFLSFFLGTSPSELVMRVVSNLFDYK